MKTVITGMVIIGLLASGQVASAEDESWPPPGIRPIALGGHRWAVGVAVGFWDDDAAEFLHVSTKWRLRTHFMINYQSPLIADRLRIETGMLLLLSDVENGKEEQLSDAGTYLRLVLSPRCSVRCEVSLTLFPMANQQLRLGHQYGVSHGQENTKSWFWAPGFLLRGDLGPGHYFVGYKARIHEVVSRAYMREDTSSEVSREVHHSLIAGTGWDLLDDTLRLELTVGRLAQGLLDVEAVKEGARVYAYGGAVRVAHRRRLPLDGPLDVTLDRGDANWALRASRPHVRVKQGWGHMASLEGVILGQRLADLDAYGQITVQPLWAMALLARVGWSRWLWEVGTRVLSTSFVLKDEPGLPRYWTLPDDAETTPEARVWATAQYHVAAAILSVGLTVELAQPATITTRWSAYYAGSNPSNTVIGEKTAVMSGMGWVILPTGEDALPETRIRLQVSLDLVGHLHVLAWAQYVHDPNMANMSRAPDAAFKYQFDEADYLGLGFAVGVRL